MVIIEGKFKKKGRFDGLVKERPLRQCQGRRKARCHFIHKKGVAIYYLISISCACQASPYYLDVEEYGLCKLYVA